MQFAHEERECDGCNILFKSTKELRRYKDSKYYIRKTKRGKHPPDGGCSCLICQKQLKSKTGMKQHFKICQEYSNMILKLDSDSMSGDSI